MQSAQIIHSSVFSPLLSVNHLTMHEILRRNFVLLFRNMWTERNAILWRLTWNKRISPCALYDSSDTVGDVAFGSQSSVESNRYKVREEKIKKQEPKVTTVHESLVLLTIGDVKFYRIIWNVRTELLLHFHNYLANWLTE